MNNKIKIALLTGLLLLFSELTLGFITGISTGYFDLKEDNYIVDTVTDLISIGIQFYILSKVLKMLQIKIIYAFQSIEGIYRYLILGLLLSTLILISNHYLFGPFITELFPMPAFFSELNYLEDAKNYPTHYYIFFAFSAGIIFPFLEEIYLRGILYNSLRTKYGTTVSIFFVCIIFLIFHPLPQAIIYFVLINILFCFFYEKKRTIMLTFILHSYINLTLIIINVLKF